MADVSLISVIHDPDGGLIKPIRLRVSHLARLYQGMYVVATQTTDNRIIEELERNGCVVEFQRDGVGTKFIGDARRMALSASVERGHAHSHFADMDRILHWVDAYPNELRSIIQNISHHDFLVIGRTRRAMNTHPRSQLETEGLANTVCSLLLNREVDITAASRGIFLDAAELILRYSKARYCETDSEWPIIIRCKSNMSIGYIEVDGLEFEDWLKRPEEVEKAGGLENWKRSIDENPEAWLHRMRSALGIAETALSTYNDLTSTQPSEPDSQS